MDKRLLSGRLMCSLRKGVCGQREQKKKGKKGKKRVSHSETFFLMKKEKEREKKENTTKQTREREKKEKERKKENCPIITRALA